MIVGVSIALNSVLSLFVFYHPFAFGRKDKVLIIVGSMYTIVVLLSLFGLVTRL